MSFYEFAPVAAVLDAAYGVVSGLAALLEPVAGAAAAALAVVVVTLFVRAALLPLGVMLVRSEFTRRRIAPKLAALQKRFKSKPEVLQKKMVELYREEKSSPFAGMLPALAQAPVLSIVYALFLLGSINGHSNELLGAQLLGAPLGDSLFVAFSDPAALLVHVAVLVLIAVTAWFSRLSTLRFAATAPGAGDAADSAPAMRRTAAVLSWMPFATVVFASIVPLAAAIYLAVSTTWTLIERVTLRRLLAPEEPAPVFV